FQPPIRFGTGAGPNQVIAGDLNGDGRQDLITANEAAGSISLLVNASGFRSPSPLPHGVLRLRVWPNPLRDHGSVFFVAPERVRVRARLFDALGREVAAIDGGVMSPGAHTLPWPQRLADGRTIPTGIYFLEVRAGP